MSHTVRCVLALVALLAPGVGLACDTATGLEGMVSIPQCDPTTSRTCVSVGEALYACASRVWRPLTFVSMPPPDERRGSDRAGSRASR